MIERKKIEDLLKLPTEERRTLMRLLEKSLSESEFPTGDGDQPSRAAQWLLSMAGRYSGGPGDTASRADEILRAEIDRRRGLTTDS